jgi:excisionase family DNA binding protein
MTVADRSLVSAGQEEAEAIAGVAELAAAEGDLELRGKTGSRPLPQALRNVLMQAAHELLVGNRVSVIPIGAELTTQQAAEFLNMSRPFLVQLLEAGAMPYHMVGTHRRIRFEDVAAYRTARSAKRRRALSELAVEAQEQGAFTS